jgi:hypothetical protein
MDETGAVRGHAAGCSILASVLIILGFLPVISSAVLLIAARWAGDVGGPRLAGLCAWFAVAAGLQFFGTSGASSLVGLLLQTALAVYLILRWKASAF